MADLTFEKDRLRIAGLTLAAPLSRSGQLILFDSVKSLTHDQLEAIAPHLGLPLHGLVDTWHLSQVVAGELQLAWFREATGAVPVNVASSHEARRQKYEELVVDLKKRGTTMTTKAKATKAAKKEAAVKKALTYSILKSKLIGTPYAKKVEDKEVTSHVPLVAQVLLGKADKAWTLAEVLDAVKATKRYGTKSGGTPTEANVRGDLNILEKEGLVKVAEAA